MDDVSFILLIAGCFLTTIIVCFISFDHARRQYDAKYSALRKSIYEELNQQNEQHSKAIASIESNWISRMFSELDARTENYKEACDRIVENFESEIVILDDIRANYAKLIDFQEITIAKEKIIIQGADEYLKYSEELQQIRYSMETKLNRIRKDIDNLDKKIQDIKAIKQGYLGAADKDLQDAKRRALEDARLMQDMLR